MQNIWLEGRDLATFKREMFNKDKIIRRRHYAKREGITWMRRVYAKRKEDDHTKK